MNLSNYLSAATVDRLFGTAILIISILLLRHLVVRAIRRKEGILSDEQRRWISRTRNLSVAAIITGLILIWATTIHNLALSLTAVAVALVIATKELILCFSGALLRAGTGGLRVGDWIRVGEVRGEVIDSTFLSTTLQEIDSEHNSYEFTGRTMVLPNSLFFGQPVMNENFRKRYVYHRFTLTMDPHFNVFDHEEFLKSTLKEHCVDFEDVAKRYNTLIESRTGIDLPGPEPSIRVTTTDLGRLDISVTVFCPTDKAVRLEQRIMKDLIGLYFDQVPQRPMSEIQGAG